LTGYHQRFSGERAIHPVVLPKAMNLRRGISLLTQEITPSIRIRTKPVQSPTFVPVFLLKPASFRIKVDCLSGHLVSITGVDGQTLSAVFASLGGDSSW